MGTESPKQREEDKTISGLNKYEALLDNNLTLQDFAPDSKNMKLYEDANSTLENIVKQPNINDSEYKKLYQIIVDVNSSIFGDSGIKTNNNEFVGVDNSTSKSIDGYKNEPVNGGDNYYTDSETQVGKSEIKEHWYGNEISKINFEKTIKLNNGMTCSYKLNTNVYKKEIETDNWFFEIGAEIGEYEFKNKEGKIVKRDTITIKEWMDTEYVELDGTNVDWYDIDDYDRKIKKGPDGKPDLEGTLEKLIKYYANEEPDDFTYDDQIENSKVTKITNEQRLKMLTGNKEDNNYY